MPPLRLKESDRAYARAVAEHPIELVRYPCHPALVGLVAGIVGIRERAPGLVHRRQPAGSLIPLVISFGNSLVVDALSDGDGAGRSYGSFVAGVMPGYASTTFDRGQDSVQVYLTPLGAYRILGLPGSLLARRVIAVDDIGPVARLLGRTLPDRLRSARGWPERFAIVEERLLRLAGADREPDHVATFIWRAISASGGRVRIGELVERSGWSHRHVVSRFRDQLGLTPKAIASLVRFERAAADLGSVPLADIAARHGYADQSHLAREIMRYAGESPVQLSRARRPTAYTALGVGPSEAHHGRAVRR